MLLVSGAEDGEAAAEHSQGCREGCKDSELCSQLGQATLPCHPCQLSIITLWQITSHLDTTPARDISSSCHSP